MAKGNYTYKVFQFKDGELVTTYSSTSEASKCGFDRRAIYKCANGQRKQYRGFVWKYEKVNATKKEKRARRIYRRSGISTQHPSEYNSWKGMVARCINVSHASYPDYGGRGIKVCESWLTSFENFFNDMGKKPTKTHSIERINNDGNYELSNCKWATPTEQANNRRTKKLLTYNGKCQTASQWAREYGIDIRTFYSRVCQLGWSIEDAINKEVNSKFGRKAKRGLSFGCVTRLYVQNNIEQIVKH